MIEIIKLKIAKAAWIVYLWATNQSHYELLESLLDEARREAESERKTAWLRG